MEEIELAALVVDNGTGLIKAGLAGEIAPRKCFPTLYGSSRFQGLDVALDQCDYAVGHEAFAKRGTMNIIEPVKRGVIADWDIMEKIWHHTFYNQLKVDPQEHPALITDAPQNESSNKEKATEIFFENFNVPSFYIGNQSVLGLLASGATKGIVLDSGEGCTHVVPIYEAYPLPHSTNALDISGRDLTDRMMNLLIENGLTFSKHYDVDVIKMIKEKKTYISLNYDSEMKEFQETANSKDAIFELPDGKTINIGH
jgi:actin